MTIASLKRTSKTGADLFTKKINLSPFLLFAHGELRKHRAQLKAADLLVIDDLFLRRLPASAGDELADVLMSRYEKRSTIITSNRPVEDWATLLGDVVIVTPLLDRLMHHAHLLKFEGKSWRLREAAARVAKRAGSV
ncbi:MAG: ATP-binding protein [Gammaproteobacteria bacterium]|nr:ATP-binding protein [Gammaproteobacteria bacterium]MBP6050398.1 ATP-binding protein [Pseudomonadales bacterium]MBK6583683.1 ATP-binding protein [Gammaproteobacteria bacterium]MBK7170298.1 ATP-binding protein [Gammaproteobacteria bacterium]MBK7522022.1 ATP-binding protein [Gammaproteobacteria bacterium]